jgi:CDP-6-deoxy-D-xylo-4-hexulose-3-dehydrase
VQGFDGLTDELLAELKRRGIPLIEDVCESHGATHNGKRLGSIGWMSNFSYYYAHHMSTIEGGMVCTNDPNVYQQVRMLRSHGMVRESNDENLRADYQKRYPELNPDFIFAYASHNMRSTEINAVLGLSQLKRLDKYVRIRAANYETFLKNLNPDMFQTDFLVEGNSNYALTLVLNQKSMYARNEVEKILLKEKVEYRRGMAGGGNQLRQPYIKRLSGFPDPEDFQITDHVHFYSWYIGNYPTLAEDKIIKLCKLLNKVEYI